MGAQLADCLLSVYAKNAPTDYYNDHNTNEGAKSEDVELGNRSLYG